MMPQSIANKKHRLKIKQEIADSIPQHNDLVFEKVSQKCVFCHKTFHTALSDKNKLELTTKEWLKFYQKRPFLGVIVCSHLPMNEAWHGLCYWQNDIKQGFSKI